VFKRFRKPKNALCGSPLTSIEWNGVNPACDREVGHEGRHRDRVANLTWLRDKYGSFAIDSIK
jgi:hypothetical protein